MKLATVLSLSLMFLCTGVAKADTPSLLKMFKRAPAVEADASKTYELSEEDGPWLILATNFVGAGSKERAERLALEIRDELNLPAYIYKEKFDFTGTIGRDATTSRAVRYANRYRYDAYAVLVGEYDSVSHPSVERDLKKIRTAKPKVYENTDDMEAETNRSNPVTTVKAITHRLLTAGASKSRGPMGNAFVTRNPMLPEQYFAAPQVDSFVHQLNEGTEYSLMKCEGKYTVVVKTFEGLGKIIDMKKKDDIEPSMARLDKFAADADKMTRKLRAEGVEAYQFHDRSRSLVTIGSFDTLGRELPDGRFEYDAEIRKVMKEFSAFNVRPELAQQVPAGTKGVASNNVAMIPFDVEPTPISVPKPTRRSLYGATFGNR